MLTGDNPFTAVNIAHSCGLIDKQQKSFIISQTSRKKIKYDFEKIINHIQKLKKNSNYANYYNNENILNANQRNDFCLIITGDALTVIQKDGTKFTDKNVINDAINNSNQNKNPFENEKNSKMDKSNRLRAAEEHKEIKEEEEEEEEAEETEHDDILIKMNHRGNSINGSSKDYDKKNKKPDKKEIVFLKEDNENETNLKKESLKSVIDLEGIEHGVLIKMFLEVITSTNTVICSRVSPKQKADLILLVKKYEKEDLTTLAIGDGANDVNMITAADVGIGIMGNEGQQAARASDYVIGQFSFLKRLLFVHGREAQRKNAFAISYILWKNFLYVVPIIIFGFYSHFSSQMLFDNTVDILYNILFTAYPIGWFATYDKERNYDELENNPKFYRKGLENNYFNIYIISRWYFYGLVSGGFMFLVVTYNFKKYYCEELWFIGHTILLSIVFFVNFKLLIKTKSHNCFSIFLFFASNISFVLVLYLINKNTESNASIFFTEALEYNRGGFYYLVILMVSACMLGEYAWESSLVLLKTLIEIIYKKILELNNKRLNMKKKEIIKKDFEANRLKEKEEKLKNEDEMSKDYKIDFLSNSMRIHMDKLYNNKIHNEEEIISYNQSAIIKENDVDNSIEENDSNFNENNLADIGKADDGLLGFSRRYTGFCPNENKPDALFLNHLLIENFVDEQIKKLTDKSDNNETDF